MKHWCFLLLVILQFSLLSFQKVETKKSNNIVKLKSGFSIHQDTINLNVNGEMTHALKFRNKYYILFEQNNQKHGGYEKRWLYIFSNGQIEKIIDCPKEMNTIYLDFYVRKDSIILKPDMDEDSYGFDLNSYTWYKIKKADDLIFEDENYFVYSLDFGEWGEKTWFRDKKTGIEYAIESTTPLINKIGTTYYLSDPTEVLKINNPKELNKCDNDVTYENIEKSRKQYSWYSKSKGFENVYNNRDNGINYFSYKPHIVTSFVLNNELLHVYETDSITYLSRIKNNKILPFEKVIDNINFYNNHFSYRCRNSEETNELLKFNTKKENVFGLMDVIKEDIFITYFVNDAELNPKTFGMQKSNEILVNRLNTILTGFNKLIIDDVESIEKKWRTFDITPNHTIGIDESWNPNNYPIDTNKSYQIIEDSIVSNEIMYFASKETNLIRAITIDWEEIKSIENIVTEELAFETFKTKYKSVESIIIQELGQPNIKQKETKNKYPKLIWETSKGIKIELIKTINSKTDYKHIRLVVYSSKK